jgi:hypothetical protein
MFHLYRSYEDGPECSETSAQNSDAAEWPKRKNAREEHLERIVESLRAGL